MDSSQIMIWMIIACVVFIILLFLGKPAKMFIKMLTSGVLGTAGIYLLNFILTPFGISVGINLLTLLIVSVLGLPGLAILYITSWIL